ncbi:hypothetical protein M768_08840 [Cellulosimicrobium cellulans F16]|uniref:Uncharacterized protein n=1 Tax=Cellulosimicrobium cellulans F16 TaxID=1350482 RepID=A0A0M0F9B2_CELCE|nr:hypothetical protein M768_08840 [Cellulosimicrobium cellulans F16]
MVPAPTGRSGTVRDATTIVARPRTAPPADVPRA